MTCDQAMELMSAMLDGELDPKMKEALEAHLETCPECKALADTLRGLDEKVAELREPAPESLKRGVLYRIDQATGKAKKPRSRWFGPGTAIGAVAAVLVLLVGIGVIPLKASKLASNASPAETRSAASGVSGIAVSNNQSFYSDNDLKGEGPAGGELEQNDGIKVPAEAQSPEVEGMESEPIQLNTWYRGGNATGTEELVPVSDDIRDTCTALSTKEDAAVLLYTEFSVKSLFELLETERPELYELVKDLDPVERDGLIAYRTDCGTVLAIHEWLLENLPRSEYMEAGVDEAETSLRIRMEELDPGSGSLYRFITWSPPDHIIVWPGEWSREWAIRFRSVENWELFFPDEDFTPNADKTAYLAFIP